VRVILKREVAGLGRPGDVKDLAIEATAGEMKVLARARDAKRAKQDRAHADAEELAKRLSETTLVFRLKAGDQGKTFGSVTSKDIAEALQREQKVEIDKTKVHLPEPLKALGVHQVEVRLLTDVRANVTVAIEPAR
jgi:large subunit ribosomal protein L9